MIRGHGARKLDEGYSWVDPEGLKLEAAQVSANSGLGGYKQREVCFSLHHSFISFRRLCFFPQLVSRAAENSLLVMLGV